MRKVLVISGVPIDDLDVKDALAEIDAMIEKGRAKGSVHTVATVDAAAFARAADDPEWRETVSAADLIAADGRPLVWGARLLGARPAAHRMGAGLVPALAAHAARVGHTLCLLAATPDVAERAAAVLRARYPRLNIVGTCSVAGIDAAGQDVAVSAIRAARPDILLVALGSPEQEKWIALHGREAGAPVSIGVGNALELLAGSARPLPGWLHKPVLQAPYRFVDEARCQVRQSAADIAGLARFTVRQAWTMRRERPKLLLPGNPIVLVGRTAVINVCGRLDSYRQMEFAQLATTALVASPYVVVNLAQVTFLDSSALSALVGLAKRARSAGGEMWLAAVPAPIARVLSLTRLDRFMAICPDVETALGQPRSAETSAARHTPATRDWTVVPLPKRLDAATAPEVLARCCATLARNPRLVLDLSATGFLASAGFAALVHIGRQAKAAGGELRVASASPDVMRTIKLLRLDLAMRFYPSVRAAAGTGS